jgi:hypothetical protein
LSSSGDLTETHHVFATVTRLWNTSSLFREYGTNTSF